MYTTKETLRLEGILQNGREDLHTTQVWEGGREGVKDEGGPSRDNGVWKANREQQVNDQDKELC